MAHISFVLSLYRFHHVCNITIHCVLVVIDVGIGVVVDDDDDVGIVVVVDDDDADIGVFDDDDVVLLMMMCLSRSAQRDDWSVA